MLSADTVVGGVELMDVKFDDDESVASLLEKLEPHNSESSSAIIGAASMEAIVVVIVVVNGGCVMRDA
jgi:hypothetical protein